MSELEVWKIHKAEIHPVPDAYGEIIGHTLLGVVELGGKVYRDICIPVFDLDEAYEIKKWCDTKVEPYELEIYETEPENDDD